MLRTCAAPPWVVGSVFPKLGFCLKDGFWGVWRGHEVKLRTCATRRDEYGFMSDKHGFRFYQHISPGAAFHHAQTPCLSSLLPQVLRRTGRKYSLRHKAAHLISMVFKNHHIKPPGANTPQNQRPCLELVQPEAAGNLNGSTCSKHGFPLVAVQTCTGRLSLRTETMLI